MALHTDEKRHPLVEALISSYLEEEERVNLLRKKSRLVPGLSLKS